MRGSILVEEEIHTLIASPVERSRRRAPYVSELARRAARQCTETNRRPGRIRIMT